SPIKNLRDKRQQSIRHDRGGPRFPAQKLFNFAAGDLADWAIMPFLKIGVDHALHLATSAMLAGVIRHEGFGYCSEGALGFSLLLSLGSASALFVINHVAGLVTCILKAEPVVLP